MASVDNVNENVQPFPATVSTNGIERLLSHTSLYHTPI